MATKKTSVPRSDEDLYIAASIAHERQIRPFHNFVCETLGVGPFEYDVILDEVHPDGWRMIYIRVFPLDVDVFLSTIYLSPVAADRWPADLDMPL